jgi:hypothetical protein
MQHIGLRVRLLTRRAVLALALLLTVSLALAIALTLDPQRGTPFPTRYPYTTPEATR